MLTRRLKEAYGKQVDTGRVKDVEEISGHGVKAFVDGRCVAWNSFLHMPQEKAVPHPQSHPKALCALPQTRRASRFPFCRIPHILFLKDAGYLLISDVVKPNAAAAVAGLKEAGVKQVVMLPLISSTSLTRPVSTCFP